MQSYKSNADNPWNLFFSDTDTERLECKNDEATFTACVFESFLSSTLPSSFTRSQNIVRCELCKILVIRNRYKKHYEDRHNSNGSINYMIPFDEINSADDNGHKRKKLKRIKKKRTNAKEKVRYPIDVLEKKSCKKVKGRPVNKRHHSKCFLDNGVYLGKSKKLRLEHGDVGSDRKDYFMSVASTKTLDHHFCDDSTRSTYDIFPLNDLVYCSTGSVHRTSSDSSTPPPLSLATLQTLSSPSSLNILNDPPSVVNEHYFLTPNDLSADREGISSKYQIESLPWENFPSLHSKDGKGYNLEPCIVVRLHEERDGEVERAVQSITTLCDGLQGEMHARQRQICERAATCDIGLTKEECQPRSDMFSTEEASVIDCFLDEVLGSCSTKDQCMDFNASSVNMHHNNAANSNVMEDYSGIGEYQIDNHFINNFNLDYDEKFETLINNTMNEFVTQSPQNICSNSLAIDKRKSYDSFDATKHCGVPGSDGVACVRSLLCKLHTMPQKRQVPRPGTLTTLIKTLRDHNKSKKLRKKQAQLCDDFKSCSSSKRSNDSFTYNCSSTRSTEEAGSFLDHGLSTPDLDVSVLSGSHMDFTGQSTMTGHTMDPRPLVKSLCQQHTVVYGNRSLVVNKPLLWRHRPRAQCQTPNGHQVKHISCNLNQMPYPHHEATNMSPLSTSVRRRPQSVVTINNDSCKSREYVSQYSHGSNTDSSTRLEEDPSSLITHKGFSDFNQQSMGLDSSGHRTHLHDGVRWQPSSDNVCLSLPTQCSSASLFPGFNSQVLSINPQFISGKGISVLDNSRLSASSLANDVTITNPDFTLANSGNINDVRGSGNNRFISILEEGVVGASASANTSILYPVRNNTTNQIMVVMNPAGHLGNDSSELLFNDSFVSLNHGNQQMTSVPINNTYLTLKQSSGLTSMVDGNHRLSSSQIVSMAMPMELQRLSDPFSGKVLTNDNLGDQGNNSIYQINQTLPSNHCVSASVAANIDCNNVAKPLTVQSSTINGVTQRFIILPDGTISTVTQQPNNVKSAFNAASLQHPIFSQLSNYGHQNQTYFLNQDNIIIAPNTGPSNDLAQQIIMPQLIQPSDLNCHSSSALTFVHPQHTQLSQTSKSTNRAPQNHFQTQIPVDASQQKISFNIQNSYPNQVPGAFFITAAPPTSLSTIPLKQHILLQPSDHLVSDISLLDSSGYFDGRCNAPHKSTAIIDKGACTSGMRGVVGPCNEDFDIVNHVMTPQSIVLQPQTQSAHRGYNKSNTSTSRQASVEMSPASSMESSQSSASNAPHNHMMVSNASTHGCTSESLAQFSGQRRQSQTSAYINVALSQCSHTMEGNMVSSVTGGSYKSVPPPLVISQQLVHQSLASQARTKSLQHSEQAYHQSQQSHQTAAQYHQIVLDDNSQFSNEYMVVQSLIA